MSRPSVLVLSGGPDAERAISLASGEAVAEALRGAGHRVTHEVIDRVDGASLSAMTGEVIFPVLHGVWGEGGPLQALLEHDGRPFVGSVAVAARLAMDKLATKIAAGAASVRTPRAAVVVRGESDPPVPLPLVVKPTHEGSSVGLHVCADAAAWSRASEAVRADDTPGRVYMAEALIGGRELTVGLVERGVGGFLDLPLVEIVPSSGVYDYDAKYTRGDTRYVVDPELPPGVAKEARESAVRVAEALGVRHLARVDFLLDSSGVPWLLEVNTIPGFTGSSLLPKSAAARGLDLGGLVSHLVAVAAGTARAAAV